MGVIAAGLGAEPPQVGVRIEVRDDFDRKVDDNFLHWDEVDDVEIVE